MKRAITMAVVLGTAMLVAGPASAKGKAHHAAPPCHKIRDALASGKTPEQVAKDLHVTQTTVSKCEAAKTEAAKTEANARAPK